LKPNRTPRSSTALVLPHPTIPLLVVIGEFFLRFSATTSPSWRVPPSPGILSEAQTTPKVRVLIDPTQPGPCFSSFPPVHRSHRFPPPAFPVPVPIHVWNAVRNNPPFSPPPRLPGLTFFPPTRGFFCDLLLVGKPPLHENRQGSPSGGYVAADLFFWDSPEDVDFLAVHPLLTDALHPPGNRFFSLSRQILGRGFLCL